VRLGRFGTRNGVTQPGEKLGHQILEHRAIEGINLVLTAPLDSHQVGKLENGQVMRQRGGAQTRAERKLAGCPLAAAQKAQDGAAVRIGQSAVNLLHYVQ
jgi:hypothetical protein